ncbi:helix-turn-helix domain-containing protein [Mesorhizobium australicum]|uniref:Helix-turn-helix domain-containing protein n=1 Tax=Mesorhizobium australicum TaxID=536018 RepID=A0ACC6SVF3_9HYPH
MPQGRLLTQEEVAALLRCSTSKVKRLRLSGQLAYLPGRPVMIEETDLEKYLESVKRKVLPPSPKKEKGGKPELEDPAVLAKRIFWARENFQFEKQRKARGEGK